MGLGSNHDANIVGQAFGRFDLVPGEEKEGSPVYRQAHSKEIFTRKDRWGQEIPAHEFLIYR